jgi:hypothetical protein
MSNEAKGRPVRLTDAELNELFERSKDDRAIIVGSEVRQLVAQVRSLKAALRIALPLAKAWAEGEHKSAPVWDDIKEAEEVLGDA